MTLDTNTSKNKGLRERPLSPHLSVYKWQISNSLSILHRLTGLINIIGSIVIAALFISVALGPDMYGAVLYLIKTWPVIAAMFIWSAAMYYHLLNGIRHLFWDVGLGFSIKVMTASGIAVLIGTVVLTACTWHCLYSKLGF